VALAQIDGEPVIVSAGGDGMVQVWDARSGQSRASPSIGHSDAIWAVATGQIDGEPVIVSAGSDGTVRVWDMHLRERCCISTDAEPSGVVCTPEGLIVVATGLGLAAFQPSMTAVTVVPD
jgi:WD40 repeat protein